MNNNKYTDRVIFPSGKCKIEPHLEKLILNLDVSLGSDKLPHGRQNIASYKGWLILVKPDMACSRPEIVLFNPSGGICFIESAPYTEYEKTGGDIIFSDGNKKAAFKTLLQKIHHYRSKLVSILVPVLGEYLYEKNCGGLVSAALYFPFIAQKEIDGMISSGKDIRNYSAVFGKESLENGTFLIYTIFSQDEKLWKSEFNDAVLFSLYPASVKNLKGKEIKLTSKQAKLVEPSPGHHRIRGFAGSGKTQILVYRAVKLASENKKVLIVCFNITLIHFIKKLLREVPSASGVLDNISVNYFHGFCRDIIVENLKQMPASSGKDENSREMYFMKTVPDAVLNAVKGKDYQKYDAILIDEGQDYFPEWYQMLCSFLTERDELVVVCDKKQNVFGRDFGWIDKRRSGMEKFGEWNELNTIFRMPQDIVDVAARFSRIFCINKESDYSEASCGKGLFGGNIGWINIMAGNENAELVEIVRELQMKGIPCSDITVLFTTHNAGLSAVREFAERGYQVQHIFSDKNKFGNRGNELKKTFYPDDERIKMSTIHSFKGWECGNIILCIPENDFSRTNREISDSLIYTALTRPVKNLIVLNANQRYYDFGCEIDSGYDSPLSSSDKALPETAGNDILGEIKSLTGLASLKKQIKEMHDKIVFSRLRQQRNLGKSEIGTVNILFTGNPGTGKTTVAKMLGKVFRNIGILTNGHVIEADRAMLVGKYIGHTAPLVREAVEKARGGILFIDEAYSLSRGGTDKIDYGSEAIEILLKEMTSGKGNLVIIAAGYENEMKDFLASNPGLESRFTYKVHFEDYTPSELTEIVLKKAESENYILTGEAIGRLNELFIAACRKKDAHFGNARYALSVFERTLTRLASRIVSESPKIKASNEDLMVIRETDIGDIPEIDEKKDKNIKFGFNP